MGNATTQRLKAASEPKTAVSNKKTEVWRDDMKRTISSIIKFKLRLISSC